MKKILLLMCIFFLLSGCHSNGDSDNNINNGVMPITKTEVVEYMNDGALLIDVRTEEEYESGHIDGAINISVQDIMEAESILEYDGEEIAKNTIIILYCQSGTRSNQASTILISLGYDNVYDFGSMTNWEEE